ncbi:MAG: SRPBCC domain-containing protein, partial [Hyphomicrobiales bacterium]|nr:SRPBCC domain-containing protein [Hyphomicrobiales bacterium]
MNEPTVVRREIQISAPPATVFAFLTDPEKIIRWMGAEATTEAHPDGVYLVKGVSEWKRVARGAFREVVPVHRLAYSFGW